MKDELRGSWSGRVLLCFLVLAVLALDSPASAVVIGKVEIHAVLPVSSAQDSAAKTRRASVELQTLLAAGQCEDFDQSPLMCQYALIGAWKSVWTAPSFGLTQEYWQAQMHGAAQSSADTFVSYVDVVSTLPYDGCAQAYAKLICPSFFPPCIDNPDSSSSSSVIAVLPMPVCRSVCEAANDACRSHNGGADLVDCVNTMSALTGDVQWPEDSLECTTNSAVIFLKHDDEDDGTRADEEEEGDGSSSSSDDDDDGGSSLGEQGGNMTLGKEMVDTDPYGLEFSCPTPLIFSPSIPDQYSGLACSTTCKKKLFFISGEEEYKAFQTYMFVASWISFISVSVLIFTILLFPSQRRFPTTVVLFIAIGLWFVHLASVGASFIGTDFACKNKTEMQYGISYCGFYAWCLAFGGLVSVIFWAYMSFIIFYNVALQRTEHELDRKLFWPMCLFGWLYPLIASILLSTYPTVTDMGSFGLFAWCWSALNQSSTVHQNMSWGLFYPWFFIGGSLVCFFLTGSIFRLVSQGRLSSMSNSKIIQFAVLMSIFCFYFILADIGVILGELYWRSKVTQMTEDISLWYTCTLSWRIPTSECPHPPSGSSSGVYWYEGVTFSLCGFVLFICFFVLRERTWRCWQVALTNLRDGRGFYEGLTATTQRDTGGSHRPSGQGNSNLAASHNSAAASMSGHSTA